MNFAPASSGWLANEAQVVEETLAKLNWSDLDALARFVDGKHALISSWSPSVFLHLVFLTQHWTTWSSWKGQPRYLVYCVYIVKKVASWLSKQFPFLKTNLFNMRHFNMEPFSRMYLSMSTLWKRGSSREECFLIMWLGKVFAQITFPLPLKVVVALQYK